MVDRTVHRVLVIAIVVYLLATNAMYFHDPRLYFLGSDDAGYVSTATNLVTRGVLLFSGDTMPSVFVMPGYPLWIAGCLKVFGLHGYGLVVVRETQMGMLVVTALLLYRMARARYGTLVALVAFLGVLFLPDFTVLPLFLFTESLFLLVSTLMFYAALQLYEKPTVVRMVVFAIALTIALYVRPTVALFPAVLLLWMLVRGRLRTRQFLQFALLGTVLCSCLLAPWWWRNAAVYHTFIPFTAASGSPFLIGTFPIEYNFAFPMNNPAYVDVTRREVKLENLPRRGSWYVWDHAEQMAGDHNLALEWRRSPWRVIESYSIGKVLTFYGSMVWRRNVPIASVDQTVIHWLFMIVAVWGFIRRRADSFAKVFLLYVFSTEIVYQYYLSLPRYALPIDVLMVVFAACRVVSFGHDWAMKRHESQSVPA